MESLILDRATMVVQSVGDTPGVFSHVSMVDHEKRLVLDGPAFVAIDPGGSNPYALVDSYAAIHAIADPITHVAVAVLTAAAFQHQAIDMIGSQEYLRVATCARRMAEFSSENSRQMREKWDGEHSDAAVLEFQTRFAAHRLGIERQGGCGCMACNVRRYNHPSIAGERGLGVDAAVDQFNAMFDGPNRAASELHDPSPAIRRRRWGFGR